MTHDTIVPPNEIRKRSPRCPVRSRKRLMGIERLEDRLTMSADGARLLVDVASGSASSMPRDFTQSNGAIYFLADESSQKSDLWKTDGANQNSLVSQHTSSGSVQLQGLANHQNQLVFLKSDFPQNATGYGLQLWTSQGTQATTTLVRNFGTQVGQLTSQPDISNPPFFASTPHRLFASIDGRNGQGRELWSSNLTGTGTTLLKDIDTGSSSSIPKDWVSFGNKLYFSASTAAAGEELWSTDGVTTELVRDFMPGATGSYPSGMLVGNGVLYFATHDVGVDGIYSGDDVMKWWKIQDPNAGPILIHDFGPGSGASLITTQLAYFQGQLYGVAQDPVHGVELWRTDNSQVGVSILRDINPNGDSLPWMPTATYDALYFAANDGVHGEELWKTDGTSEGTVLVKDLRTSGSSSPDSLVAKDGELFFSANDSSGRFLWQSDGSSAGTMRVSSLSTSSEGQDPTNLTVLNSTLYYSATTTAAGREPWAAKIYSWHAANFPVDIDRDGYATPLDVLSLINELNNPAFSNPSTFQLPETRPNLPNAYRFDVLPDGWTSPLDVLMVINWINTHPGGKPSGEGESATDGLDPQVGLIAQSSDADVRTYDLGPAPMLGPQENRFLPNTYAPKDATSIHATLVASEREGFESASFEDGLSEWTSVDPFVGWQEDIGYESSSDEPSRLELQGPVTPLLCASSIDRVLVSQDWS